MSTTSGGGGRGEVEAQGTGPGWYADPTGRHEKRYWTGTDWTRHVDDAGLRSVDAIESLDDVGPTYVVPAARVPRSRRDRVARLRRRRRRRRRFALVAVTLAAALGLAGGVTAGLVLTLADGDGGATVAAPVDPLVASLEEYILDTTVGEVNATDARCMADRVVETVGREALVSAGVDRGADPLIALSDEQVRTGLREAFGCLDDTTLVAVMTQTFSPSMQANLGVGSSACLIDGWMASLGRETMVDIYSRWAARRDADIAGAVGPEQYAAMAGVVAECQAAAPLTTTTAAPSAPPP